MEIRSSTCTEKVNLRIYLESGDAEYGVANYGFKLSWPGGGYSTLSWVQMCGRKFRPPPYN